MNNLMQNVKTMSSREIAELCDKDHRHVRRDIQTMLLKLQMDVPKFGRIYIDSMNREQEEYLINKDLTLTLIAGYGVELRYRIIQRWQELEQQVSASSPVMPAVPQSFSEALLLAGTLQQKIEQDAPKVAHFNAVADRKTLLNATQVAHSVGLKSPQALNTKLDLVGVYNKSIKRGKAFKAWFVEQGLGEMKQGNTGHMQPLFTTKGKMWVYELLSKEVA